MPLNENAKTWVAKLRSGEYEQTTNALRREGKFCCLGVACEISGLGEWRGDTYLGEGAVLPKQVADWLGLANTDSGFGEYGDDQLTARNDNGETFAQIANLIESEPKGLFKA